MLHYVPPVKAPGPPLPSSLEHVPRRPAPVPAHIKTHLHRPASPVPQTAIPVQSSRLPISPQSPDHPHPLHDILTVGDLVGTGIELQGELVRVVDLHIPPAARTNRAEEEPANHFQVVRKLGTGSYAIVYLVRELLNYSPPAAAPSYSPEPSAAGELDLGTPASSPSPPRYGREYAIKCLSKANLNKDALDAQLFEATVHQSLQIHPNIVTLYRTLETDSLLLLVLESVPGEDLFYFLEQSRDHQLILEEDDDEDLAHTPLHHLSTTPPTPSLLASTSQLLSPARLRLIASMFSQMCDAVAACHRENVFHRDIKPENFIVTDARVTSAVSGQQERRVVVKLTDFGLATTDRESSDMECGSAPYMSYECRNNCAPTYYPRAADVWSLGIVLINMLYHRNPWADTTAHACPAFDFFLDHPVPFFMHSFQGMTQEVAEFLAEKVFCILAKPDDERRVSAEDFGAWVKNLPTMLGAPAPSPPLSADDRHRRSPAAESVATPAALDVDADDDLFPPPPFSASSMTSDNLPDEAESTRTASTHRRRKRGARKGKGAQAAASASVSASVSAFSGAGSPVCEDHLDQMASASQDLARQLSRLSNRSNASTPSRPDLHLLPPPPPVPPLPSPASRKSRWMKNVFRSKDSSNDTSDPTSGGGTDEDAAQMPVLGSTASNVSNLIMGLNAPAPEPPEERERGRRRELQPPRPPFAAAAAAASASRTTTPARSDRNASPVSSTRSGPRQPGAGAGAAAALGPSFQSQNWRNSTSTSSSASSFVAGSAYTRFSNGSIRSVSTAATSLSAGSSWRERAAAQERAKGGAAFRPANVKNVSGIPHELNSSFFDVPPAPKPLPHTVRRPRPEALSTISESSRPPAGLAIYSRQDASTSTTGLSPPNSPARESTTSSGDTPKKVPKGQITALAKILSTLKSR